jgi:tetratricopeptide (TPR) repeat protein
LGIPETSCALELTCSLPKANTGAKASSQLISSLLLLCARPRANTEVALRIRALAESGLGQRLKSSAQDRSLQRRAAVIQVKMSDSLAELGKRNEALEHSRIGLEIFRSDPTYARSHRDLAIVQLQSKHGDILLMDGDTAAALQSYRQEQALLEPLAAADPQNAGLRFDLAFAYARVGHALSQGGNGSGALAMLERAMEILEPMARDPEHGEARSALACSHIWMGELLARTGNMPRALENYRKGAADFLALVTLLPWDR